MPTFDVHQHLWPEPLVAALARRDRPPRLRGSILELGGEGTFELDLTEHRLDRRLELLDRDGTEVAVVSLQPTLGFQTLPEDERTPLLDAWHQGARELSNSAGGRIRPFAADVCLDAFAGACVSASTVMRGGVELDTLLARLAERRQVLFVHPGPAKPPPGAPPWWSAVVDYTAQMQAAYAAWLARRPVDGSQPNAIFAVLAGGAPIQLERLASRGVDDRWALDSSVYFDVASYGRRALELCLSTFGVRQLVFGSDVPVIDSGPTLRAVRAFGDAVNNVIRAENATLLFDDRLG